VMTDEALEQLREAEEALREEQPRTEAEIRCPTTSRQGSKRCRTAMNRAELAHSYKNDTDRLTGPKCYGFNREEKRNPENGNRSRPTEENPGSTLTLTED
jgi:hypothetical protein